MTPAACPRCHHVLPLEDVNVATDVALCRRCGVTHAFSELLQERELSKHLEQSAPPAGVWEQPTTHGVKIGVSHRSLGAAIGLLAISLFWNGIVSVFVVVNTASTLRLLGADNPEWFPSPTMNGEMMGWGVTLFLWLFLTPFLAVGAAMIAGFLLAVAGRTEVEVNSHQVSIFTGIGPLGRRRRFDPGAVRSVSVRDSNWRDGDGDRQTKQEIVIELTDGKKIKLGAGLKAERRLFLGAKLRSLLT